MTRKSENDKILLVWPERLGNYQFFREWFALAWVETGGNVCAGVGVPMELRKIISWLGLVRQVFSSSPNKERRLILCGGFPDYFIWPYSYGIEVVPLIWDAWPRYWGRLLRSIKRNRIRRMFCTSSQVAEMINENACGCHATWVPEGINTLCYPAGKQLAERTVDVLELGRVFQKYHEALLPCVGLKMISQLFPMSDTVPLFTSFKDLVVGLGNSKITVCFPRCDTHPEMAGNIETLTQRYWECMLTRTIIVGRAPQELIRVLGFNPVVEVDWENPARQLVSILENIGDYQKRVDYYRSVALEKGDWKDRMSVIRAAITNRMGNDNV